MREARKKSLHDLKRKPHSMIVRVVIFKDDDEVIIAAEDRDITILGQAGNRQGYGGEVLLAKGDNA